MSFAVHIELTTEAPWANSWCAYYGIATNTGSAAEEAFEMQHEFFGPDGGQGFYVEDPADLRPTLDKAMSSGIPSVVHVLIAARADRKPQEFSWKT
jgi:thiamine pyrophosphate-dependent acetolactate synthase large subunit-like protein